MWLPSCVLALFRLHFSDLVVIHLISGILGRRPHTDYTHDFDTYVRISSKDSTSIPQSPGGKTLQVSVRLNPQRPPSAGMVESGRPDQRDMANLLAQPPEVLHCIFSFINAADLASLHGTCRHLKNIVDNDHLLWRSHYLRHWVCLAGTRSGVC